MNISPLDIRKQEFARALRGYDTDEVRAFLESIADEMANLQKNTEELRMRNVQLETQLSDFRELEDKWKTTMISAQQSAEREREQARQEADILRRSAEIKAEEILDEARQRAARYREEAEMIRQEKRALVRRLKHLLQSQIELIEILESEDETITSNPKR